MKLRELAVSGSVLLGLGTLGLGVPAANAGGLFLPGSGAVSTSRAGAAVASADDGEALGINPAGLAKTHGTTITVSAAIISYALEFQRAGTYDAISDEARPYEGQAFLPAKSDPSLPLGVGSFQPVPVVAIVSDLGGRVKNLRVAAGLYAPNAYPFRDLTGGYEFNGDFDRAPPAARYDIMKQEAALLFPSIAMSYRVMPQLDLGLRLSVGFAHLKSTAAVWGSPGNYEEAVTHDASITIDAKDSFVPTFALGAMYRPSPSLELGFNFNWRAVMHARGTATSVSGPGVSFNEQPTVIGPSADEPGFTRCARGGTFDEQKACVDLQLPMNAQVGARYKFLDGAGNMRGDIELDVGWENWGKRCENNKAFVEGCTSPSQYRIVVDAAAYVDGNGDGMLDESEIAIHLKDNIIDHRFKDTYSMRLGGSYHIPLGGGDAATANKVIVRGGVGYDTRAAEEGWLRADIDGAGRTTATIGGSYRARSWEISAGGGMIFEGTNTNAGDCNPTPTMAQPVPGCASDGSKEPVDIREGPDPINPILTPTEQLQSPVAQGTYKSSYTLLMLGFSTWF